MGAGRDRNDERGGGAAGRPGGEDRRPMLADLGLLGPEVVAAHCVHVDTDEIGLLAEHGTAVAHCPRSNAILGCGAALLSGLLAGGVRVGLGTDSPASTPSFDMFEEMRTAVYHGVRASSGPMRSRRAPRWNSLLLAQRARSGSETRRVRSPPERADLAVVSLAGSPFLPWEEPTTAVVFGGSPDRVLLTLVAGEGRYEEGGFEWHELRRSASAARGRLLSNVPPRPKT